MASFPITWHNVTAPNYSGANEAMRSAQNSFGNAFDLLGKQLAAREAVNQRTYDDDQASKVLAFKEALQNAGSVDALSAGQADRNAMLDGMDVRSRAQLLGAAEARKSAIQNQLSSDRAFEAKDFDYQNRDKFNQARAAAAIGDRKTTTDLLSGLENSSAYADILSNAVTGERNAQRFDWDKATADYAADTRPLDLVAKRLANQNAQITADTNVLNYQETQYKAKEEADTRAIKDILGTAATNRTNEIEANKATITQAAKDMQFKNVFYSDGSINPAALNTGQRAALDRYLENKKWPAISTIEKGDTAALEAAATSAIKQGYNPLLVNKVRDASTSAFDNTGASSIGIDAALTKRNQAAQDAMIKEAQNSFGQPITKNNMNDYYKAGEEAIAKIAKPGTRQYNKYMKVFGEQVTSGGYKVIDPVTKQETRFLPSLEELPAVISQVGNQWWATDSDMEDPFKNWTKSKENMKGAETAIQVLRNETTRSLLSANKKKE